MKQPQTEDLHAQAGLKGPGTVGICNNFKFKNVPQNSNKSRPELSWRPFPGSWATEPLIATLSLPFARGSSKDILGVGEMIAPSWTSFITHSHKSFNICRWKVIYLPQWPLVCSSIASLSVICSSSFCLFHPAAATFFNPRRPAWIASPCKTMDPLTKSNLNQSNFHICIKHFK